jgi:hypothetical protein
MPLRSIIVVFLRISALQLVVSGLFAFFPYFSIKTPLMSLIFLLLMPISAALAWAFAEQIARLATRGHEITVPLGGLSRMDLFAFAFVYLGLSFLISGIGAVLINLSMYFANSMSDPSAHQALLHTVSIQQSSKQAVQVLLGIICLFNANRFAKKLVDRGQ